MPPTQTFTKRLPQSLEAERAVIGSLLRNSRGIPDTVLVIPSPDYFYQDVNQRIYRAILDLHSKGQPVDFVTVAEWLGAAGIAEKTDCVYLAELMQGLHYAGNLAHYAKIVQDKATTRAFILGMESILDEAYRGEIGAEMALESTEKVLAQIVVQKADNEVLSLSEFIRRAKAHYEAIANSNGMNGGFPYGFADLDKYTGGLHKGELVILAARPSVGKTAYSLAVAGNVVVESQVPVYIASLEQSGEELASRMICMFCEADSQRWRLGRLTREEMDRFCLTHHELEAMQIFVSDHCQNINGVIAHARRLRAKKGIGLMVLDYIQLCETEDRRNQRYEQVGEITRRLKLLARELEIPILALAQLGRAVDDRPNGEPQLSDLRESGNQEADADTVLLMYRPKADDNPHAAVQKINVKIGKQRNGPVGTVSLGFRKNQLKFENYAEYPQ